MSCFGKVITSDKFGSKAPSLGHGREQNARKCAQIRDFFPVKNIYQITGAEKRRKATSKVATQNMASRIFELAKLLINVQTASSLSASHLAALSARMSIHAKELGMNKSMLLSHALGELAMDGDSVGFEAVKQELQLEILSELALLP